jgi:hypothetical protein
MRPNIREILRDPGLRRELMIDVIIATQAREGINTTYEQAAAAYDKIQKEVTNHDGNTERSNIAAKMHR